MRNLFYVKKRVYMNIQQCDFIKELEERARKHSTIILIVLGSSKATILFYPHSGSDN
jgi:hypothetical protein